MSGNTNIMLIEGRLTRDPSYTKTKNDKSLAKFSVANNRYYYINGSLQKEVYFFDIVAWGYTAEKVAINLSKGSHILVNGELRQNTYTTKDGIKKTSIYILALEIKSLDKKMDIQSSSSFSSTSNNSNSSIHSMVVSDFIEEDLERVF